MKSEYKLCVLGDSYVGKTKMIVEYIISNI